MAPGKLSTVIECGVCPNVASDLDAISSYLTQKVFAAHVCGPDPHARYAAKSQVISSLPHGKDRVRI